MLGRVGDAEHARTGEIKRDAKERLGVSRSSLVYCRSSLYCVLIVRRCKLSFEESCPHVDQQQRRWISRRVCVFDEAPNG